jgi:hypothetical protein
MSSVQEPHLHLEVGHILFFDICWKLKAARRLLTFVAKHVYDSMREGPPGGGPSLTVLRGKSQKLPLPVTTSCW